MKILLIDDHNLFRDGIGLVLSNLDDEIEISMADSYEDALPLLSQNPDLDMILLDLGLPGLTDVDALKAVRNIIPSVPVVVLSATNDAEKIQQTLNLGAQGYIHKSTNAKVLIHALKLVFSGGIYIPPEILPQVNYGQKSIVDNDRKVVNTSLTARQNDVLEKLAQGYSNKEIAELLNMAESTVRVHIAAILKTLNVSNRTRAAHVAVQEGWVR